MRRRRGYEDLRATYCSGPGPSFAIRHPYPGISPFPSTGASTYTASTSVISSNHSHYAPPDRWRRSNRRHSSHHHDGQYGDAPPWFASVCVQTVDQLQEAALESMATSKRGSRRSRRTALVVPDLDTEVSKSVSWRSAGPLVVCFRVRRKDYEADLRFDDAAAWRRIRQLASEKGADGVEREIRGMEGRLMVTWVVKRQGRIIDPRLEFPGSGDNMFERRRERRDALSYGLSSLLAGPYEYSRDYDIINEENPLAYLFLPNPYRMPGSY